MAAVRSLRCGPEHIFGAEIVAGGWWPRRVRAQCYVIGHPPPALIGKTPFARIATEVRHIGATLIRGADI